jgi:hypothetical protein
VRDIGSITARSRRRGAQQADGFDQQRSDTRGALRVVQSQLLPPAVGQQPEALGPQLGYCPVADEDSGVTDHAPHHEGRVNARQGARDLPLVRLDRGRRSAFAHA